MERTHGRAQQGTRAGFVLFAPTVVTATPFLAALAALPQGDADPAQEREDAQIVEGAHAQATVFVAADVQDLMQPVLDAPFVPAGLEEGRWWQPRGGTTGGQPQFGVLGLPLLGAVTVQAGDLAGTQQARFRRLDHPQDQFTDLVASSVLLLGPGAALGLGLRVRREKTRSGPGSGRWSGARLDWL